MDKSEAGMAVARRPADRTASAGLSGPETLRRLMHAVLAHQQGHLDDDATAVLLEWRS